MAIHFERMTEALTEKQSEKAAPKTVVQVPAPTVQMPKPQASTPIQKEAPKGAVHEPARAYKIKPTQFDKITSPEHQRKRREILVSVLPADHVDQCLTLTRFLTDSEFDNQVTYWRNLFEHYTNYSQAQ